MKQLNASYDIAGLFYSYVLLFSLFYLTIESKKFSTIRVL